MSVFIFIIITIFYFLLDILNLNREVNMRIMNYKQNSKNIQRKPLCNKCKTVFLFVITAVLIVVITTISRIAIILVLIVSYIANKIIRKKRIKEIIQLDEENKEYWKG